jgi:hypothetical protein
MAKSVQAAEDKFRKAQSSYTLTIFDTEIEVIRNLQMHIASRDAMPDNLE